MKNIVNKWYENKENVDEMKKWNPSLKEWEKEVVRYFPDGARILDIGCGLGREAFELAKLGYKVVGIDISEEVISQVKELVKEKGHDIPFYTYDGEHIDFPSNSFDVVIIWAQTFGLFYGDELKKNYLLECKRVLKQGGLLSFSTHDWEYLKENYPHCLFDNKFYPFLNGNIYWEAFRISEITSLVEQADMELLFCGKGHIYSKEDGTILHCLCKKE